MTRFPVLRESRPFALSRVCSAGLLAALLLSCSGGESTQPVDGAIDSITLAPSATSIGVGANAVLEPIVVRSDGDTVVPSGVVWSSSDVRVTRVSSAGVVTALALGTSRIAATVQGHSATATITVVPNAVASLELSPVQLRLIEGGTQALQARMLDAKGVTLTGRTVQWRTGDATVAVVSTAGVVTAVGEGSTTIVATSEGRSATAAVTVAPVAVGAVVIAPATALVQVGKSTQLAADVRDGTGNTLNARVVSWSTTTPAIVSVSSTGLVVGVASGTGTVTASSGGKSATATITVESVPAPIVVGRVTISPSSATLRATGSSNRTLTLQAAAFALVGNVWQTITNATFTWASSAPGVATVNSSGVVTALREGSAEISVTSNGLSAKAQITVVKR